MVFAKAICGSMTGLKRVFAGVAIMFAIAVPAFFVADKAGLLHPGGGPERLIGIVAFAAGVIYIMSPRWRRKA